MSDRVKVFAPLSLSQPLQDSLNYPPARSQQLAYAPSRLPAAYDVPLDPPNAGPDVPTGFSWGQVQAWDASNPPLNNSFLVSPGDDVDFLSYGDVSGAQLRFTLDDSSTTSLNLGSGGTGSFAWALTSGETYKVRWAFNGNISHDSTNDGLNITGNVGTVVWSSDNPGAITQSGNSLRWVPGETATYVDLEFTATAGGFIEVISNNDGWAFAFEDYGLAIGTPATETRFVSFYALDGVEFYEAVLATNPSDVLTGQTPLPGTWAATLAQTTTGSYSTTEQATGRAWINGKPIFERVFDVSAAANGAVLVGAGEIDEIVKEYGRANTSAASAPAPLDDGTNEFRTNRNKVIDNVTLVRQSGFATPQAGDFIVLEYTKP